MRRLSLALGGCALVAVTGAAQPPLRGPGSGIRLPVDFVESGRVERLEQWVKAVAHHVPGEEDAAIVEIAGWPNANLKQLWFDAYALAQTMRHIVVDAGATLAVRPV